MKFEKTFNESGALGVVFIKDIRALFIYIGKRLFKWSWCNCNGCRLTPEQKKRIGRVA